MRAIDADAAGRELKTAALKRENFPQTGLVLVDEIVRYLDTCPTLDVAPVRHGRWEQDYELVQGMEDNSEYPYVACNLCGHKEYDVDLNDYTDYDDLPKYCPNCGAKMDAGQEDDKNA